MLDKNGNEDVSMRLCMVCACARAVYLCDRVSHVCLVYLYATFHKETDLSIRLSESRNGSVLTVIVSTPVEHFTYSLQQYGSS